MESGLNNYQFYKLIGICPSCKKNPPAPGKARCEDCIESRRMESQRWYSRLSAEKREELREQQRRYRNNRREKNKENGLCVNCGKPQTRNSVYCIECRLRRQRRRREKSQKEKWYGAIPRSELPYYGFCYRCTKNPVEEGKKLCAGCTEKNLLALEQARRKRQEQHLEQLKREDNVFIYHNY